MARKFTFKKQPRATGLASVGVREYRTDIKLDGSEVGMIVYPRAFSDEPTRIRLCVKCDEHPGWKWSLLKQDFPSEEHARIWLNENRARIQDNFELHKLD